MANKHRRSRQHPPTGERRALTVGSEGVSAPDASITDGVGEVNPERGGIGRAPPGPVLRAARPANKEAQQYETG